MLDRLNVSQFNEEVVMTNEKLNSVLLEVNMTNLESKVKGFIQDLLDSYVRGDDRLAVKDENFDVYVSRIVKRSIDEELSEMEMGIVPPTSRDDKMYNLIKELLNAAKSGNYKLPISWTSYDFLVIEGVTIK